jgi:hypothetical protein
MSAFMGACVLIHIQYVRRPHIHIQYVRRSGRVGIAGERERDGERLGQGEGERWGGGDEYGAVGNGRQEVRNGEGEDVTI